MKLVERGERRERETCWGVLIFINDRLIRIFFGFQVHIRSRLILNGVCAKWRGWIDMDRLDGVGCVEFDEEAARVSRHSTFFLKTQNKTRKKTLARGSRMTTTKESKQVFFSPFLLVVVSERKTEATAIESQNVLPTERLLQRFSLVS